MTSREERADQAESDMLDCAAETIVHILRAHFRGAACNCHVERRGEFVSLVSWWGATVVIDEHHIRLAAQALGLELRAPSEVARAEAMGGR